MWEMRDNHYEKSFTTDWVLFWKVMQSQKTMEWSSHYFSIYRKELGALILEENTFGSYRKELKLRKLNREQISNSLEYIKKLTCGDLWNCFRNFSKYVAILENKAEMFASFPEHAYRIYFVHCAFHSDPPSAD